MYFEFQSDFENSWKDLQEGGLTGCIGVIVEGCELVYIKKFDEDKDSSAVSDTGLIGTEDRLQKLIFGL